MGNIIKESSDLQFGWFFGVQQSYIIMSRIIPPTPSLIGSSICNSDKKPQTDDDCQSMASSCYSSYSGMSAFQSLSSSRRINSLKPKLKLSISRRSTLATTKARLQNQDQNSPNTPNIPFPLIRSTQSQMTESMDYSAIKPFFNWNKLAFLCGPASEVLGDQGCLCGPVCPWKKAWVHDAQRLDHRIFQNLLKEQASSEHLAQIEKDLPRTHPQCPTFSQNAYFRHMLRQVLVAYSVYDLEMGYVQGVNMIAGVLLYHIKNESLTFWALVGLMEEQELRQIYLGGFENLQVHCIAIRRIIEQHVYDLHQHMQDLEIMPDCFLNGWLLSLMSTAIPMEYMHLVLDRFRTIGWKYVYQLVVTHLLYLKEFLLASRDEAEFLMFLSTQSSRQLGLEWMEMIQSASRLKI